MPRRQPTESPRRRLSRDRIVAAAIGLADRDGIDSLSMRRLAVELGVDPMSLYTHVRDKDGLLEAMADDIIRGIEPQFTADLASGEWGPALRATILAARAALLQHPWSARVIESRPTPTPAALRHLDTVLGILKDGGFSLDLRHHALHVLGSRVLGFSQDLFDDTPDVRPEPAAAEAQAREWAESHPHIAEMALAATHDGALGGCDDDEAFAFSLDLIIDGLERKRIEQLTASPVQ